jgi:hypothetical protein
VGSSGVPDEPSGIIPPSLETVASPLPALECERLQSTWEGIFEFGVILERVTICSENLNWSGWVFEEFGVKGLFIECLEDWGVMDTRKGYH